VFSGKVGVGRVVADRRGKNGFVGSLRKKREKDI